jgi:hypothetical protein
MKPELSLLLKNYITRNAEFVGTHQCFKIRVIIVRQHCTNMCMSVYSTAKMSLIMRLAWRLFL